jgi:hypothetical protein
MSPDGEDRIFTCPGCHDGDWADFDHFCDVIGVSSEETGVAFAMWMEGKVGWKGRYGRVKDKEEP